MIDVRDLRTRRGTGGSTRGGSPGAVIDRRLIPGESTTGRVFSSLLLVDAAAGGEEGIVETDMEAMLVWESSRLENSESLSGLRVGDDNARICGSSERG